MIVHAFVMSKYIESVQVLYLNITKYFTNLEICKKIKIIYLLLLSSFDIAFLGHHRNSLTSATLFS